MAAVAPGARTRRPGVKRVRAATTVAFLACTLSIGPGCAARAPALMPEDDSPATPALALGPAVPDPEVEGVLRAAGALIAADGRPLPLTAWLPAGSPTTPDEAPGETPGVPVDEREAGNADSAADTPAPEQAGPSAAIVALHGFNDYSAAFAAAARDWAADGVAVYAYDQRGFGANPNPGRWPGVDALVADARAAMAALAARHPDTPRYALGESMGGAILLAALGEAPAAAAGSDGAVARREAAGSPAIDGAVLVAPAVWARETMPAVQRAALWLADRLVPGLVLSGEGLGIEPTDNPETLRALWEDPLVIKRNRVDALAGVVDAMDRGLAAADDVATPLLVLYGDQEEVIPDPAVDALEARLDPGRHTVGRYPEGYHMLLRDLNGPTVRADIRAWLDDPDAPLPSGADAAWHGAPSSSEASPMASGEAPSAAEAEGVGTAR
ncbi:MAG: alpha/beta fold hydrolase [Azospirillaceae bacterium]